MDFLHSSGERTLEVAEERFGSTEMRWGRSKFVTHQFAVIPLFPFVS